MRRYDRMLEWWERRQPTLVTEATRRIGGHVVITNLSRTMQVFDSSGLMLFTAAFRTSGELHKVLNANRERVLGQDSWVSSRAACDQFVDLIKTHHPLYGRQTA